MTDVMVTVLLAVIALAIVVRTVFYGIQVIVEAKTNKKSFKLLNRLMKNYEPMFNYLNKYIGKLVDDE